MTSHHRHSPTDLKDFKRQRCSVCDCDEKFNFHIPDETWEIIVPQEYRQKVVCLSCFDAFARDKNIDYADSVNELYFAGEKATVKFDVASSEDI